MNSPLMLVIVAVALAMWSAAALSAFAYEVTPTTAAASAFCLGTVFSVFFVWQISRVMKKIDSDEKALRDLATHDALNAAKMDSQNYIHT